MTMIDDIEIKCPICNNDIKIWLLLSTNSSGFPDLDLRPPEMQRSTMNTWTQECPHCGYVSSDFNETPMVDEDFLKTESYQSCDNIDFKNNLSKIFYRQSLIESDNINKFYALLHCAWACDDAEDIQNAVKIRNLALETIKDLDLNEDMIILKADLMRRAQMFDDIIEEYSNMKFGEDILNQICEFQVEKSKIKDDGCYTIKDVVKN